MSQEFQVGQSLVAMVITLYIFGFPVKYYWKELPWHLIPIFGLLVFGGTVTPILYIMGVFSFTLLYSLTSFFGAIGLGYVVAYFLKKNQRLKFNWKNLALVGCFFVGAISIIRSFASLPVPGGIDSALHSLYMTWVETSGRLDVQYPLGMHTFFLFFEHLLHIHRAYVMQAFSSFLYLTFFPLTYALLKSISGKSLLAWLGVVAAFIDVSFYNNALNGSLSHIVAIDLILCFFLFLQTLKKETSVISNNILALFSVSLVYFHFITWYLVLPALWVRRVALGRNYARELPITGFVLLFTLPLALRLSHYQEYSKVFLYSSFAIVFVELILCFFGKFFAKIIYSRWFLPVIGLTSIILFVEYRSKIFLSWEPWYGWTVTALGMVGLAYVSIKRKAEWVTYSVVFLGYITLYASFDWSISIVNSLLVVKELLFYYGFTVPLMLFAALGLYCFVFLGSSRIMKFTKTAIVLTIALLVFFSRMSNLSLIGTPYSISKYGENSGFGLYFTKNDVALTNWVRENVHDSGLIANPGGLYGVWASSTGHETVYLAYSQMNVGNSVEVNQKILDLMTDASSGSPELLLSKNIHYLFVPEELKIDIVHPYLYLVKSIGSSNFYKIEDTPSTAGHVGSLQTLLQNKMGDVHLSGDYDVQTIYHGNAFYYQFQDASQRLLFHDKDAATLMIQPRSVSRPLILQLHSASNDFSVKINGKTLVKDITNNGLLIKTNVQANQNTVIEVKNTGHGPAEVTNIIIQLE